MALCISVSLLIRVFFLVNTALGVTAQDPLRRATGVAFGLTPDYGVAAIHLKGGVSVPIARIEGPPAYQAFMRNQNETGLVATETSTLCRWVTPGLNILSSAFGLDVDICRHPDVNSVKALLATLKAAVESYLGTNICYAALNFDHKRISHFHPTYQDSVIQEALQGLGVSRVTVAFPRTAEFLVLGPDPRKYPDSDDFITGPIARTVLAIDYSLHWFSVGLYLIEEGFVDGVETTVIQDPRANKSNQLDAFGDTLTRLFATPPLDLHKDLPGIERFLLSGDDSRNEDLHKLLGTFHDEDLVRNANISSSVFDAAMFNAEVVHNTLDQFQFKAPVGPPAFGCMWRSKLYREQEHTEL